MEIAWKNIRGQLSICSGDEFERVALHFLRVLWPTMVQAPRLLQLDRRGIDLCVVDDTLTDFFPVVVQAKGFKVAEELLQTQVDLQILPSIKKFADSGLRCDTYVLVHNRDGSDKSLRQQIETALQSLVRNHKAKCVLLWDRSAFIKAVRKQMHSIIRAKLHDRANAISQVHQSLFHFGHLYVDQVPIAQSHWQPGSAVQNNLPAMDFHVQDISSLIASHRQVRYALLTGTFGIGKTSAVLQAALKQGGQIIHVPAHQIRISHGSGGTNHLMTHIAASLDLLDDFPPDTSETLRNVCGAALANALKQQTENPFILVVDGLDEHSFYGTNQGLQWLSNQLAELRCPIILTTRKEHFFTLFGNYGLALDNLSRKGGGSRVIDLWELGAWDVQQALQLLDLAKACQPNLSGEIDALAHSLQDSNTHLAHDLLAHPLFLQMVLDLIVDGQPWETRNANAIIEMWVRQKILRDLRSPRLAIGMEMDVLAYVDTMMQIMQEVALHMDQREDGTLDEKGLAKILATFPEFSGCSTAQLMATSLLIPADRRRIAGLRVKFFHRQILEFFVNKVRPQGET